MAACTANKTAKLIALFVVLYTASRAAAQVSVSLPESGAYRVGQFMYVDVRADEAARNRTIVLNADGAIPTFIDMRGESHARVPLLMLANETARLRWSIDSGASGELNMPLIVQPAEPRALNALAGDDAFAPTLAWNPGAPIGLRRPAMMAAILIAILMMAGALLFSARKAMIAIASIAMLGAIAFEIARRNLSPTWRAEGQIIVAGADGAAQFDSWQYLTARAPSQASIELPEGALPVFVDAQHARATLAGLHYDASRKILSLRCTLQPGMKVAVVQRRVTTHAASPLPTTQPIARALRSPMSELARRMYVDQHTRIVDEGSVEWTDNRFVHWASIVLHRESE